MEVGVFKTKVCSKCKVEKDEWEFYRCQKTGGTRSQCKDCLDESSRNSREKNKALNADVDVYDGTDRLCSKCKEVYPKEKRYWEKSNSGPGGLSSWCLMCLKPSKNGYRNTGDLATDIVGRVLKKWTDERRGKRNKKDNAEPWIDHSEADFFDMLVRQQARCDVSDVPLTPENVSIDHIIPIVKGGTHELSNLRLVAWSVNGAMGSLDDATFIELCRQVVNYQLDLLIYGNEKAPVSESHTGAHSVPALGQSLTLDELP
jgi:hypothetical protein